MEVLPEASVPLKVTHPTDLIPGLIGEPAGGRVSQLVLQPNTASEEEEEFLNLQFTLGSVGVNQGRRGGEGEGE